MDDRKTILALGIGFLFMTFLATAGMARQQGEDPICLSEGRCMSRADLQAIIVAPGEMSLIDTLRRDKLIALDQLAGVVEQLSQCQAQLGPQQAGSLRTQVKGELDSWIQDFEKRNPGWTYSLAEGKPIRKGS